MTPFIKDPKTKEPSVTLTLLLVGFLMAAAKMLFSGITVGSFTLSAFGGGDFSAVIAALGGLYLGRRHLPDPSAEDDTEEKK